MSKVNCDSCANLREYAPEFVQNGVTDNVAASLKNNTGLNPTLTVLHRDCQDLNDINDCLIGRAKDELPAYDVCDWKDFEGKLLSNLYESEKAQIASICGLWDRTDRLCTGIDSLFSIVGGSGATKHPVVPIEAGLTKWQPYWNPGSTPIDPLNARWVLEADILTGAGCDVSRRYARYRFSCAPAEGNYPYVFGYVWDNIQKGDVLAVFRKEDIVPTYMPESLWESIAKGGGGNQLCTVNRDTILRVAAWGYVRVNGVEFNPQLRDYGEGNLVLMVSDLIGPSTSGASLGAIEHVTVVPF